MSNISSLPVTVKIASKSDVGLANVDNTADINKPVSSVQQVVIDAKVQSGVIAPSATVAPNATAVQNAIAAVAGGAATPIVNNLVTADPTKALSAAQGVVLKAADDANAAAVVLKADQTSLNTLQTQVNGLSAGSSLPVTTVFAQAIPFDAYRSMGLQNVSGALTFTKNLTASAIGGETTMSLMADGVNLPNFAAFTLAGTTAYDNTAGRINEISFFHTASGYYYGVLAGVIIDTVVPTLVSASVANATPSQVDLVFSKLMNALWSVSTAFTVVGHTVSSITRLTGTTGYLTLTAPFVSGEAARTLGYTQPSTNLMQDLSGNLLATIASAAITNNVAATSGTLSVAPTAYGALNVTTSGFLDWTALNDVGLPGTYYRKVAANLIDITAARVNATFAQNGQTIPYSWTAGDSQYEPGAPTQVSSQGMVATNTTLLTRYRVIFPAGTVSRKARLYFKSFNNGAAATGKFTLRATLSDGSAAPSVTAIIPAANLQNQAYEWTFTAGSAGQTLTVDIEIAANDVGQLLLDLATYGA